MIPDYQIFYPKIASAMTKIGFTLLEEHNHGVQYIGRGGWTILFASSERYEVTPLMATIKMPEGRGYEVETIIDIFAEHDGGVPPDLKVVFPIQRDIDEYLNFQVKNSDRIFVIPQPYQARYDEVTHARYLNITKKWELERKA